MRGRECSFRVKIFYDYMRAPEYVRECAGGPEPADAFPAAISNLKHIYLNGKGKHYAEYRNRGGCFNRL